MRQRADLILARPLPLFAGFVEKNSPSFATLPNSPTDNRHAFSTQPQFSKPPRSNRTRRTASRAASASSVVKFDPASKTQRRPIPRYIPQWANEHTRPLTGRSILTSPRRSTTPLRIRCPRTMGQHRQVVARRLHHTIRNSLLLQILPPPGKLRRFMHHPPVKIIARRNNPATRNQQSLTQPHRRHFVFMFTG